MKINFNIITTLIGLFIGFVGILVAYAQISKKEISYEIIYSIPAVQITKPIKNYSFDVRIDNKKKEKIFTTLIKIKNTGNVAIEKSDIIKPVSIRTEAEIYSSSIVDKKPKNSEQTIDNGKKHININFGLLNKEDWFLVEIITTNHLPKFELSSRIKDAGEIIDTTVEGENNYSTLFVLLTSFFFTAISHGFLQASWLNRSKEHGILKLEKFPYAVIYTSFVVGKYATLFVALWYFTKFSISDSLTVFILIYASTLLIPGVIFLLKNKFGWFALPSDLAFQKINPKKNRKKR